MNTDYLYHGTVFDKAELIFRPVSFQENTQDEWDDLVNPDNNTAFLKRASINFIIK